MNVDLTIYLTREGRHYVAQAMPLDVVSSGPTPEAARDAVYEAVRAFLLTAADQGTLEEVLEECGYERRGDQWVCPDFVALEKHELAIAV